MLSLIVAVSKNNIIGKQGGLPWHLPSELAHFRKITTGHPIIMGRKTHQSIGQALPERTNIVVTHSPEFRSEGCQIAGSLEEAVGLAQQAPGSDEIFVIGGRSLFEKALPKADKVYLTKVDADIDGDVYFIFDPVGWVQTKSEKHPADDKNSYGFEFTEWQRKR